jgi:dihydroxyacid dehydratase/phosphogluconate dehydratase
MSGTSYGDCVLHVSPEAYICGPLGLVENGDEISIDVAARSIHQNVSEDELAARKARYKAPAARFERGYGWMFAQHIQQANEGCDFDFLQTAFGKAAGEPDIY